ERQEIGSRKTRSRTETDAGGRNRGRRPAWGKRPQRRRGRVIEEYGECAGSRCAGSVPGDGMRRFGATVAVAAVGVCLAGCTVTADPQAAESPPAVRIDPAVVPSESRPLAPILPTAEELSDLLGTAGFTGPLVDGGADALLA